MTNPPPDDAPLDPATRSLSSEDSTANDSLSDISSSATALDGETHGEVVVWYRKRALRRWLLVVGGLALFMYAPLRTVTLTMLIAATYGGHRAARAFVNRRARRSVAGVAADGRAAVTHAPSGETKSGNTSPPRRLLPAWSMADLPATAAAVFTAASLCVLPLPHSALAPVELGLLAWLGLFSVGAALELAASEALRVDSDATTQACLRVHPPSAHSTTLWLIATAAACIVGTTLSAGSAAGETIVAMQASGWGALSVPIGATAFGACCLLWSAPTQGCDADGARVRAAIFGTSDTPYGHALAHLRSAALITAWVTLYGGGAQPFLTASSVTENVAAAFLLATKVGLLAFGAAYVKSQWARPRGDQVAGITSRWLFPAALVHIVTVVVFRIAMLWVSEASP